MALSKLALTAFAAGTALAAPALLSAPAHAAGVRTATTACPAPAALAFA